MPDLAGSPLRVAIISRSQRQRDCLKEILEVNGLSVVSDETIQRHMNDGLDTQIADVLLVNLDDSEDPALDVLIDQTSLPILFNDSSAIRKQATPGGRAWGRRLSGKLLELVEGGIEVLEVAEELEEVPESEMLVEDSAPASELYLVTDLDDLEEEILFNDSLDECEISMMADPGTVHLEEEDDDTPRLTVNEISAIYRSQINMEMLQEKEAGNRERNQAKTVWVLGASIGGPQAVKEFLAALPADINAGFILAQHIGAGFVDLLADQLGRVTALDVTSPSPGMVLCDGQLMVMPVEEQVSFDRKGSVKLKPVEQKSIYSPSIDEVMIEAARHYSENANAIVFSGMGNDGTRGCQVIAERGGMVWAQSPASCVISSMADSVRTAGLVSLSGTPVELAENLKQYLISEE